MTLLQILVIAVVALFCILFVRDGLKHFIGYNPSAPNLWARIRAWWPGFVKRHIVDDDPYDDESHAETRYSQRDDYIDWSKVPEGYDWVAVDEPGHHWSGVWAGKSEPTLYESDNGWLMDCIEEVSCAIIGPLPPWRESLRKRPGK